MRIAFGLIGGGYWTGGLNYLVNLLSAIHSLPGAPVEAILFTGTETDKTTLQLLEPYLAEPPRISKIWDRHSASNKVRVVQAYLLQKDSLAEKEFRKADIDLVFQHSVWYGLRFPIPTLAWIADFQHKHLPDLFSPIRYWNREIGYKALAHSATKIMLSSESAKHDCENFYPATIGKTEVLRFSIRLDADSLKSDPDKTRIKYNLPNKFIYLPNQFWKHKNHMNIIYALNSLKDKGNDVIIAVSGNLEDNRHPTYPGEVISLVKTLGLEENFIYIGMIPRPDIIPLMRASISVINPSLFEGWSTTVEEAKAIGVPLLLSDIKVHKEQAPEVCLFFDPKNPESIASQILTAWDNWEPRVELESEQRAIFNSDLRRKKFAEEFVAICERVISADGM